VERLLALPVSAYHASVTLSGETVLVLVPGAVHHLGPDGASNQWSFPVDAVAALQGLTPVFWSEGAFWRARLGQPAKRLGDVPARPVSVAASEEYWVWLERTAQGRFSLHRLVAGSPKRIYSTSYELGPVAIQQDVILFAEARHASSWRLGSIRAAGGDAQFSDRKGSRLPALLAVREDRVYYYGGLRWGIRSSNLDTDDEQLVARGVVCSPMAVTERLYCAHMQGLSELSSSGQVVRTLTQNRGRLITSLAADSERVVWIRDVGDNRLEVETMRVD